MWVSLLTTSPVFNTADLFRPALLCPKLVAWANAQVYMAGVNWQFRNDDSSWELSSMIERHTFWVLSPTLARQAMSVALMAWVEAPWASIHLFVVPRILQQDFGRVKKHIQYIGQYYNLPGAALPSSPLVPFSLFYLAPFVRSLLPPSVDYDDRMDVLADSWAPRWVHHQATHLRGLH